MTTHAGVVAFRQDQDQTFYLIVSSSDGTHWVLPKGHIESGESQEMAALRELKEEAGVEGGIVSRLSVQHFKNPEEDVIVQYFLVRELSTTEAVEDRQIRWEDESTVLRLLSFADTREVFRSAVAALHELEVNK